MITHMNPASPSVIPHGWLISLVFTDGKHMASAHLVHFRFLVMCEAYREADSTWFGALKGSHHHKTCPLHFPLATDCYLAFQLRLYGLFPGERMSVSASGNASEAIEKDGGQ